MITVDAGQIAEVEQFPLAPLRWETLPVDLSGIESAEDAKDRLLTEVRSLDNAIVSEQFAPDAVGCRVAFTGRTRCGAAAEAEIKPEDRRDIYRGSENRRYFIERVLTETRPEIDLGELARRADPPGLLAQRLMWLEEPEGHTERDRLVARAKGRLENVANNPLWSEIHDETSVELDVVERLREAGFRALEKLLSQAPDST